MKSALLMNWKLPESALNDNAIPIIYKEIILDKGYRIDLLVERKGGSGN